MTAELDKFMWKSRQWWSHGERANISLQCEQGRAWATLFVNLGPRRLPTHYSRPRLRPPHPRPTPPAPTPKHQGIPPATTTIAPITPGTANGISPPEPLPSGVRRESGKAQLWGARVVNNQEIQAI